jgi:exonuclease III
MFIKVYRITACIKVKTVHSPANPSSVCPTFFLSNICHISNKIDELSGIVSVNNPSVIMITETWLSKNIPDSAIKIGNNYEIFRLDKDNLGGGILAYISSYIRVERITHLEETGKEVLWLVLKPPRTPRPFSTIIVVIVYYPPGQRRENDYEMIEYLSNGLDIILTKWISSGIIIAGDFNMFQYFDMRFRVCSRFGLRKTVSAPTRGKNTLDQIDTNMFNLFDSGRPKNNLKIPPTTKRVRLMKPRNRAALSLKVAKQTWDRIFRAEDVDEKVKLFNETVIHMLDTCPSKPSESTTQTNRG